MGATCDALILVTATVTDIQKPAQAGFCMSGITDFADGISAIDTHHIRPALDASYLLIRDGRAAFVDTGTALAVPHLLAALDQKKLSAEAVDWIFLTHIHLDHAGGAGALLKHLPNARVLVHPKGAPHLVDPTKLIQATIGVYGADFFAATYGEILPIPADRLQVSEDGVPLLWVDRTYQCLHTPGHALHHYVLWDPLARAVFAGDNFGVSYRQLDVSGRAFVMPATTPSHFDPSEMHRSIDRIAALQPAAVYLTHYGQVTEIERLAQDLHRGVDAYVAIADRHPAGFDRTVRMCAELFEWLSGELDAHGDQSDVKTRHEVLDLDIDLNVQGLISWATRTGTTKLSGT